jgi:molybdopterin-guanine dinucleotide biosynthesis protein B
LNKECAKIGSEKMGKPKIIAISGVKNSGKTTLITKIIPKLINKNLKIATIKHDGHDFINDCENTDSYQHKLAGAYGTAVFSDNKYMIIKETKNCNASVLIKSFPEADLIILEGFKNSNYPKMEVIRSINSVESVCKEDTLIGIVSDLPLYIKGIPLFGLEDTDEIVSYLLEWIKK